MSESITNYELDLTYLNSLMRFANRQRSMCKFMQLDISSCQVSYLSTRGSSSLVLKEGYRDLSNRQDKFVKESPKLRAGAKNYMRLIKNADGKLLQVENYKNGDLDCIYQVQFINDNRYLFPFLPDGSRYEGSYIYVTKYRNQLVTEELMVDDKQLIYEGYSHLPNNMIDYLYIKYVPQDHYPIREIVEGNFTTNPVVFNQTNLQCWLRDLPTRKSIIL